MRGLRRARRSLLGRWLNRVVSCFPLARFSQLETPPTDFRFPISNQSRHCFVAVREDLWAALACCTKPDGIFP